MEPPSPTPPISTATPTPMYPLTGGVPAASPGARWQRSVGWSPTAKTCCFQFPGQPSRLRTPVPRPRRRLRSSEALPLPTGIQGPSPRWRSIAYQPITKWNLPGSSTRRSDHAHLDRQPQDPRPGQGAPRKLQRFQSGVGRRLRLLPLRPRRPRVPVQVRYRLKAVTQVVPTTASTLNPFSRPAAWS